VVALTALRWSATPGRACGRSAFCVRLNPSPDPTGVLASAQGEGDALALILERLPGRVRVLAPATVSALLFGWRVADHEVTRIDVACSKVSGGTIHRPERIQGEQIPPI
jgi:hypothetical protein